VHGIITALQIGTRAWCPLEAKKRIALVGMPRNKGLSESFDAQDGQTLRFPVRLCAWIKFFEAFCMEYVYGLLRAAGVIATAPTLHKIYTLCSLSVSYQRVLVPGFVLKFQAIAIKSTESYMCRFSTHGKYLQ
jgi:hypothetical protein